MKKMFAIITLVSLCIVGCQNNSYVITGDAAEDKYDSVQVFLTERINREWINLDSTYIVNGKFMFTGEIDSTRIINLFFKKQTAQIRIMEPFVLEKGKIIVKLDSTIVSVTGTTQNDAFEIYKKEIRKVESELDKTYNNFRLLPDSLKTKELEDSVKNKIDKLYDKINTKNIDYSMNAVNTVVGTYIFTSSFYNFDLKQKEAIFEKMEDKTKAIPRVAELIAATEREKRTSVGQQYIDFGMLTPNDKEAKLSDFVGKSDYLLVDFWASWCGPCIRSFPELVVFYQNNKRTKFDILGVSLDSEKESWVNAIKKHNLVWHHISDLKFWDSEGARMYAVNFIPSTVLIDKNGKIVGRNMKLEEIQNLLNQ